MIFASARTSETDRVTGFDIGGDDYLPKPYSMKELLSRVNALIRRAYGFSEEEKIVTFGSVSVNITARTVSKNGEPVLLSLREKLGDDPAKPAYIKTVGGKGIEKKIFAMAALFSVAVILLYGRYYFSRQREDKAEAKKIADWLNEKFGDKIEVENRQGKLDEVYQIMIFFMQIVIYFFHCCFH